MKIFNSIVRSENFKPTTKFSNLELFLQRLFFGLLVLQVGNRLPTYASQPQPNGFAHYIDFTFLSDPLVHEILKIFLFIFVFLYISDRLMLISLSYMLFYHVALGTLMNSQGAIGHARQIIPLVLLAQFCAYTYSYFIKLQKQSLSPQKSLINHPLAIYFTQQTIVGIYMIAGISKLINSGIIWRMGLPIPGWIRDVPKIAVGIIRSHSQNYYNSLSPETLLDRGNIIANWIVSYPNITRIMFSMGLFLELFAFLALLNRRWSFLVGISLVFLHISIEQVMQLRFRSHIYVLLIYLVNIPFLIVFMKKKLVKIISS